MVAARRRHTGSVCFYYNDDTVEHGDGYAYNLVFGSYEEMEAAFSGLTLDTFEQQHFCVGDWGPGVAVQAAVLERAHQIAMERLFAELWTVAETVVVQ